ncbi:MAG: ATP-binding protein [Burkholderiales bacterium]|nr:ATP-binding protein [Burkholderiales bacterium]
MPALADEYSSTRDFVWNKDLEYEFRRETDSRDALWIPVGLLTMGFLWAVLLAFSFPASITGVSWIGGFIHDVSGVLLRLFIIGVLASCAAAIYLKKVEWPQTTLLVSAAVVVNSAVFVYLVFREVLPNPGPNATVVVVSIGPATIFGIFWINTMMRLPAKLALILALLFAATVLSFSFATAPFPLVFRQALYYAVALGASHVMSRLAERRERILFLQRGQLVKARQAAEDARRAADVQRQAAEVAKRSAEEALAKVEEAKRDKERLIAAINHDLRQPMTAAVMHLDLLSRNLERSDLSAATDQTRKARTAIELLGGSLDHVLNVADDERDIDNFNAEYVDVSLLLRTLLNTYAPQAERVGLRCRIRLPLTPLMILSNRQSLFRVIGNLVANAIKFTPAKPDWQGGVLIAASVRGGACRIEVIDTGIGISPEKIDEIWLPYHQLKSNQEDRMSGLGLGLFLVRRIVEKLPGHRISVSSRLGRGTRFTLTIPYETDTTGSVKAFQPWTTEHRLDDAAFESLRGAYVLLLEDDREARVAISDLLEDWGVIVSSGPSMETLKASHDGSDRIIDAVISDYALQAGLNGLDAFESIDAWLGYSPKRVLITGADLTGNPRILASPSVTVFRKPFAPSALASHLLAAVDSNRRLEAG